MSSLRRLPLFSALALLGACSRPASTDDEASDTDTTDTTDGSADNLPPSTPELLSPSDGALDVPISTELCWSPASDPEGDSIAYRVWVDDIELANGKLGSYGFSDTCTGPLDFLGDRQYAWKVRAFDPSAPERESPDSATWEFTTQLVGDSELIFEDDFSGDLGWTVEGDANTGAWVRGVPQQVSDDQGALAQPGACANGDACMYTGHNPDGLLGEADVDEGAAILISPPFDPSGYAGLSVSLDRFFYRSTLVPTGVQLELALLMPDPDAPEGVAVHVLELLDGGAGADPANVWTTVAFAACGIELVPDTRLRITARDLVLPEQVIVEAAIDSVRVEGYLSAELCQPGLGAICDPDNPAAACGADLVCCPRGPVFSGVYRCEPPVPAIGDDPPAQPGGTLTGPLGCDAPDLEVIDDELTITTSNIWVAPDACTVYEGCVDGTGWRRVLRFDTKTANVGSRDLVLGVPSNHPDLYSWSPCHAHYHFDDYARYTLLDGDSVVASGHKQAFCLVDWESWAWPELGMQDQTYTCFNQGISLGWSDTYAYTLDCQWIDVTDVAPGEYTLRMEVNLPPPGKAHATLVERDYGNNVLELPVVVEE